MGAKFAREKGDAQGQVHVPEHVIYIREPDMAEQLPANIYNYARIISIQKQDVDIKKYYYNSTGTYCKSIITKYNDLPKDSVYYVGNGVHQKHDGLDTYFGYEIMTSNLPIRVFISHTQVGSEKFGIILLDVDGRISPDKFVGKKIMSADFGYNLICDASHIDVPIDEMYDFQKAFVNIKTNVGEFQIFAYNYQTDDYHKHHIIFQLGRIHEERYL
jgi:hypothetical protein